jgi:hypothetical protein
VKLLQRATPLVSDLPVKWIVSMAIILITLLPSVSWGQCNRVLGDINGNDGATLLTDNLYSVRYFQGLSVPPPQLPDCSCPDPWIYATGDVDNNCVFNGVDVVHLVAYFWGGPALIPCINCGNFIGSPTGDFNDNYLTQDEIWLKDKLIVPITVHLGDVISIPVFVQTDDYVPGFIISVNTDNQFLTPMGGTFEPQISGWNQHVIRQPYVDFPTQGYTTQTMIAERYPLPTSDYLHAPAPGWIQVGTFIDSVNNIPANVGQLTYISFGDAAPLVTGPVFCNADASDEWKPLCHGKWIYIKSNKKCAFAPDSISFKQKADTVVTYPDQIIVSNEGDDELTISGIVFDSSSWFTAGTVRSPLAPGESDTVDVTVDTHMPAKGVYPVGFKGGASSKPGSCSDPDTSNWPETWVEFTITGPYLSANPESIFYEQKADTVITYPDQFVITNNSVFPVTYGPFVFDSSFWFTAGPVRSPLAPGESDTVDVTVDTHMPAKGVYPVGFKGGASSKPGSCIDPDTTNWPEIHTEFTIIGPDIGVLPDTIRIQQNTNTVVIYPDQIIITNTGTLPLTVSSITFDSTWITAGPVLLPLAPGQSDSVAVTCNTTGINPTTTKIKGGAHIASNVLATPVVNRPGFSIEVINSSGYPYVVGDANGSGTFTGLDVTYSVRFFKGGPLPPYSCECPPGHTWYVSGDVNGSCTFTGLDITYMVRYFKGGPAPIPCPDCPPAAR